MRRLAAAAAAAGLGAALAAGHAAAAPAPASLTVDARPGKAAQVARGLERGGLRVQRRDGRRFQVVAAPSRATALARLPGVAGARESTSAFGDDVQISQGLERQGADILGKVADGGAGLTIAVLDLGFGQNLARLQALGEIPATDQLETLSFDAANGLAGRNAYGNRTNHGEIVAQTVFDYAPKARYLLVNYHTEADFIAATDALIARRPDIVVHSNSFIEGPFDGTGPTAQAVDRAAAAGILWFNSAGNYALLHWSGTWADADADGDLDWPNGDNWTFPRSPGQPITFALSWTSPPGGPPTDLDLSLEQREADGSWTPVAASEDRQSAGLPTAERITGFAPQAAAEYRLRVVRESGPPPAGELTLFSREIPLAAIGGLPESSIPTPGDAAGAIAIGAVDWRGNARKSYSSQGPTDDGRLKPDLVAPTDTRIMGPAGVRAVGGTSNAAPNAAGAAAVVLAAARRAGQSPTAGEVRQTLDAMALDLGAPGPDTQFGLGRIRVTTTPPRLVAPAPAALASVRGRVAVRFRALSRTRVSSWTLAVDGRPVLGRSQTYPRGITLDTRRLPDGWHALSAVARDYPGNAGRLDWSVKVDNTRPVLIVRSVKAQPLRPRPRRAGPDRRPRTVRLVVALQDPGSSGRLQATITATRRGGRAERPRVVGITPGQRRTVVAAKLVRGRYTLRIVLADRAGNSVTKSKTVLVK
ncbi:MAG TPA: S8 family serine peptidase [Miltoncostaeaceae bacterium]|nr:S8 family serine peptidase [Miltoncostaeaceae bacterium]